MQGFVHVPTHAMAYVGGVTAQRALYQMLFTTLPSHQIEIQRCHPRFRSPSWRLLNPKTQRLVELAAVATSPPLVHRSLEAEAPAEAAVAPGTAGAQQLAAMSIEADSYAQAGGRMTQVEWHALHTYR